MAEEYTGLSKCEVLNCQVALVAIFDDLYQANLGPDNTFAAVHARLHRPENVLTEQLQASTS